MKLFKHQEQALDRMKGKQVYALLMEMGTGKSFTVIKQIERNHATPCLIITKNSIKYNWVNELLKAGAITKKNEAVILEGSTDRKAKWLTTEAKYFILNWESLRLLDNLIIEKDFKSVIADESTAIKNPKAKQTKSAHKIARYIDERYILTGTPTTNNPLDVWGQFFFLDPRILYFTSFWGFRAHYAQLIDRMIGGRSFKDVIGFKNVDELLKRIAPYSFSVRKSDCFDLPPIVRETRDIEMSPEMTRIYKELARDLVATLKDADGEGRLIVADNVLTKLLRCQQLLGGTAVDSEGKKIIVPENKTKEILEILDEIGDRKVKVLIWARFVDEIIRLTDVLNKAGYKTEAVYGAVKVADRQGIIDRFNGGNVEIIVAQQQTIGFGVNITGASVVIYYSNDWSLANRQQSESRAHRYGNVNSKITIIDLISKGTMETTIVKALESKKRFQDLFFESKDTAKKIMEGGE